MGITWKVAMPLLSTLAALVIIVNSAEEDLEGEYRYGMDIRPRAVETGTPAYDELWRAVDSEPMIQQHEIRHDSLDEITKRHRPVRKRKRRPPSSDEETPQERFTYLDEHRHHDEEYKTEQSTESSRRRRKKPESRRNRWTEDYLEIERPLRRRGQRRKRPSIETWPEFNESDMRTTTKETPIDEKDSREYLAESEILEKPTVGFPMHLKEDKSLSEFSMEDTNYNSNRKVNDDNVYSVRDNVGEMNKENIGEDVSRSERKYHVTPENNRKSETIDPTALKDILKKSNGTSLSELLQLHNLSLTDLLRGREKALSILKSRDKVNNPSVKNDGLIEMKTTTSTYEVYITKENNEKSNVVSSTPSSNAENSNTKVTAEININTETVGHEKNMKTSNEKLDNSEESLEAKENSPALAPKRRFPVAIRRKLRMRPLVNATFKGQLNRDLMALTARKYLHLNRNSSKAREWKNVISSMNTTNSSSETNKTETGDIFTITTSTTEASTIVNSKEHDNLSSVINDTQTESGKAYEADSMNTNIVQTTNTSISFAATEISMNATEMTNISRHLKPGLNRVGLRRQAFNHRLKKKRLKQMNSTTESPQDDLMKDLYGMGNLVSSSEFIARTQTPKQTTNQDHEDLTTLDDYLTTETSNTEFDLRNVQNSTIESLTTPKTIATASTTEESAKIEIEEILNDTRTSARLSRILMERNMTLTELVEHRERGSSQVHLADIFHNASKEPNPPEPFLSKSLIEPISKETYPLRALLDANLHDPAAKATTIEPNPIQSQFLNIPVVMDFGNNVNENGENMGIMSLFNKLSSNELSSGKSKLEKDSEGTPYVTTVININATTLNDTYIREGRVLKHEEDDIIKHDVNGWNELFSLMRRDQNNETEDAIDAFSKDFAAPVPNQKNPSNSVTDGDGVIVLEDLQHLKDFDSNIAPAFEEKLEVNAFDKVEGPTSPPGILEHIPSNTRSVTVATASIVGLAMILFLFTYAAFKWKQQRKMLRKRSFCDEHIPTPVFESRKGHKNNCSTRSISPMLASTNIYSLNTLDSHNGKDSPDYMWDSLRKPFQ